jgi:hypothetical protein
VSAFDETVSTLDYAHRAKHIKNKPQKSVSMSKRAYMKELLAEIASLKRDNEVLRSKNGIIIPPERYERMVAEEKGKSMQIDELLFKIKSQQDSLDGLTVTLTSKEALLTATLESKAATEATLASTVDLLESTQTILSQTREQLLASQGLLVELQRALFVRENELAASRSLVDAQRATEYRLTNQALEVLAALETTLDAKAALHAKVERKAVVEEHNNAASRSFQQRIEQAVDTLDAQEISLGSSAAKSLAETQTSILSIANARSEQADKLQQSQSAFHADISAQTRSIAESVATFATSHAEGVTTASGHARDFHQTSEAAFLAADQKSKRHFEALANQSATIQRAEASLFSAVEKEASEVLAASKSFIGEEVSPALKAVREAAVVHSSESVAASQRASSTLVTFKTEQQRRVAGDAHGLQERVAALQAANNARVAEVAAANAVRVAELAQANAQAVKEMHTQQTQAAEASAQRIVSLQVEQAAAFAKLQAEQSERLAALQAEQAERVRKAIEEQHRLVSEMQVSIAAASAALQKEQAERVRLAQEEQAALVASMQAAMVAQASERQKDLVASSAKLQEELVASVAELQQALVAEVDSLVSQARASQIELVERSVTDVVDQVATIVAKEGAAIAALSTGIDAIDAKAKSHVQSITTRAETVAQEATVAHAALQDEQIALDNLLSTTSSDAVSQIAAFRQANETRAKVAQEEFTSVAQLTSLFAQEQSEAIITAATTCTAADERLTSWLAASRQADEQAQTDLSSRATALGSMMSSHCDSSSLQLRSARALVSSYIASELRKDVPLGSTPQKSAPAPAYPSRAALARTAPQEHVYAAHRAASTGPKLELRGMVQELAGVNELVEADSAAAEQAACAQAEADAITLAEAAAASRAAALALEQEATASASASRSASPRAHASIVPLPMAALEPVSPAGSIAAAVSPKSASPAGAATEIASPLSSANSSIADEDAENAKPVQPSAAAPAEISATVEKPAVIAAAAAAAPAPTAHKRQLSAPKINVSAALADKTAASKANIPSTRASSRLRAPSGQ